MKGERARSVGWSAALATTVALACLMPAGSAAEPEASDPAAVAAAEAVLQKMGGRDAWNATRFLAWHFGPRIHHWDRFTGDVRIESGDVLVLMNLRSRRGRVFRNGEELTDPAARQDALEQGYAWWVNDSYWLLMPYKLLDSGAHLRDGGQSTLEDGRPAQRLIVTFTPDTGLTPRNKYDVWIAEDSGLVEQWAYYADASDPEPKFVLPWAGWRAFGKPPILLATDHGRNANWHIEVLPDVPRSVFERP